MFALNLHIVSTIFNVYRERYLYFLFAIDHHCSQCRDIGIVAHGEVSRVLSELHTAMKTYQLCYAQSSSVEAKFRLAEQGKLKYEEANPNKLGVTRKHRTLERDYDKVGDDYCVCQIMCVF